MSMTFLIVSDRSFALTRRSSPFDSEDCATISYPFRPWRVSHQDVVEARQPHRVHSEAFPDRRPAPPTAGGGARFLECVGVAQRARLGLRTDAELEAGQVFDLFDRALGDDQAFRHRIEFEAMLVDRPFLAEHEAE